MLFALGQCLNFTCSFALVLMLRRCITVLRSCGVSDYLPLDQHIYYHKLTGAFIVAYSLLHTVMHCFNFRKLQQTVLKHRNTHSHFLIGEIAHMERMPLVEYLFSVRLGIGWVNGSACLTGWFLLLILLVMITSSMPFMRRSGNFEVRMFKTMRHTHLHNVYILIDRYSTTVICYTSYSTSC